LFAFNIDPTSNNISGIEKCKILFILNF